MVVEARVDDKVTVHAWNADRSLCAICPNSNVVHIYKTPKGASDPWEKVATLKEHDAHEQLGHHDTAHGENDDSKFYVANKPTPDAPLPLYPGVLADGSGIGGCRDDEFPDTGFADLSDALARALRGAPPLEDEAALRAHWQR